MLFDSKLSEFLLGGKIVSEEKPQDEQSPLAPWRYVDQCIAASSSQSHVGTWVLVTASPLLFLVEVGLALAHISWSNHRQSVKSPACCS